MSYSGVSDEVKIYTDTAQKGVLLSILTIGISKKDVSNVGHVWLIGRGPKRKWDVVIDPDFFES